MKRAAYLMDSHCLLWAMGDSKKLSRKVRGIMEDCDNRILISVGTLWELSIKQNIGKVSLPTGFFDNLFTGGYERLAISDQHLSTYRGLPLHHRDPFDRLLIAQAIVEGLPLLSSDSTIGAYEVSVVW